MKTAKTCPRRCWFTFYGSPTPFCVRCGSRNLRWPKYHCACSTSVLNGDGNEERNHDPFLERLHRRSGGACCGLARLAGLRAGHADRSCEGGGLAAWIGEGDAAGDPWTGEEWEYTTWGGRPAITPGERVYVVCEGKLRGFAPLTRLEMPRGSPGLIVLRRAGAAVAVTLRDPTSGTPRAIIGFRGIRYRWWDRGEESLFPDWKTP